MFKKCLICGKEFKIYPSDRIHHPKKRFCSNICRGEGQSKYQSGRKYSVETKLKMSLQRKGKRLGKENSFYGKKHTLETKEKISLSQKGKSAGSKNYFYGKNLKGGNSYRWKGGITPIYQRIRHSEKYIQWRQSIFIRDNFTCKCGQVGGALNAHHIKPFHVLIEEIKRYLPLIDLFEAAMLYVPLWNINNGITMCKTCHDKINKRRRK